jgi:hypothetical protein
MAASINDMMLAYAQDAVDYAKLRHNVDLNFSVSSIEAVEKIADQLFQARPRGLRTLISRGPTEEEMDILCKMLGGYIGEVYRTQKGGDWALNDEFSAIGIQRGDAWIFPPAKVHKRLTNGDEDNLWSYFRVSVEEPWRKGAS